MAYYISDVIGIGRFQYYLDGEPSGKYYHKEIKCSNSKEQDLCSFCTKRESKLKEKTITRNNRLEGSHHNMFHRRVGEPIPLWSHAEGGEWDKEMIAKGYSKEMVKTVIDEKKLSEFLSTLKGKKEEKIQAIMKEFPISKTRAGKYITDLKKDKKSIESIESVKSVNSLIETMKETMYIDPDKKEEIYDIVEVTVIPTTIKNVKYYYEPKKNKLYTLEYEYVGRYDRKNEKICEEFPDSDSDPFTKK